jgi:hypothetical protein
MYSGDVLKHMKRKHFAENPFGCSVCGRRYKTEQELKCHAAFSHKKPPQSKTKSKSKSK